ncbi:MAG: S8 family serine peptidase [Candidatus Eisenbacteria bacterium]|nr:S8 family serine peptidase [Candidatus Eisenbacteria bacterium]
MNRVPLIAPLVFALAAAPIHAAPPTATPRPPATPHTMPCAAGELLFVVDADRATAAAPFALVEARAQELLARFGLERLEPVGPARGASGVRVLKARSARPGFDPIAAGRALQATGAFRAVCPNYRLSLFNTLPNDPDLPFQWYVDDGGVADVRLPAAWDIERGDSSIVIAIMDTGVDTGHPDLAGHVWQNPGEIPVNGVDDDGNGFVDDVAGWDFGRGDNDPNPEYTQDASGLDVGFHGSFVAGIASAETNNAEGIAGATWSCRLMPLKVSHPDSGITSEAVAGAFAYAADQRVAVLNMSLGGPGDPGVPEFFQALVDMANAAGVVCVAAAGNDGDSVRTYPAAASGVIAVAATDDANARASFSNWGSWVDVAAPGSLMWSSICRNYTFTDLDQIFYIFLFGWDGVRPYMYGDGTSFACPLTAGVCALVRSRYPWMTPAQVAGHLIATGDPVTYDRPIGPRVNAYRAVSTIPLAVEPATLRERPSLDAVAPNPVGASTTLRFTLAATGPARLEVLDCAGRHVRDLARGTLDAGPHATVWDGHDDGGRRLAGGIYFLRLRSGDGTAQGKLVLLGR